MTTVFAAVPAHLHETARRSTRPEVRIALLGLGNVGGAVAELASQPIVSGARLSISAALVRDLERRRAVDTSRIPLTVDPEAALASDPDVVVEVLGGLEPARSIVVKALSRGIPVVTANKTLLATHGDELLETSARTGTPLLYEASVLAGVPFLGTFARRRFAREVTAIAGIVNGTSNFILSRMSAERVAFSAALADAQRAGYAEPDPAKDIDGDDAVEKLCVLLRHFGGWSVAAGQIEKSGIADIELQDLQHAVSFDGFIRPVIAASWNGDRLAAYAGPAFVNASSPLARVSGVQNAVSVTTRWTGDLFFSGPGAGPTVTAATPGRCRGGPASRGTGDCCHARRAGLRGHRQRLVRPPDRIRHHVAARRRKPARLARRTPATHLGDLEPRGAPAAMAADPSLRARTSRGSSRCRRRAMRMHAVVDSCDRLRPRSEPPRSPSCPAVEA